MPAEQRPSSASKTSSRRKAARSAIWASRTILGAAAIGAMQFVHAPDVPRAPFAQFAGPSVWASGDAFGTSREVKLRFTLPGQRVEFPLDVVDDPRGLQYQWVAASGMEPMTLPMPLGGATIVAPTRPGFYQLLLLHRSAQDSTIVKERVTEPTLAVMVPFAEKAAGVLNGYRIGTYLAERFGGGRDEPQGFLEVQPGDEQLSVSKHFHLGDFVTHDAQTEVWPKYVALNPRLLDKLELVVAEVAKMRGVPSDSMVALDVHSGLIAFGSASQDIVIDAYGDGRITRSDSRIVSNAVDSVEELHPDLVGGLGVYTSDRYRTPYVHIDARGHRSRWRG